MVLFWEHAFKINVVLFVEASNDIESLESVVSCSFT